MWELSGKRPSISEWPGRLWKVILLDGKWGEFLMAKDGSWLRSERLNIEPVKSCYQSYEASDLFDPVQLAITICDSCEQIPERGWRSDCREHEKLSK